MAAANPPGPAPIMSTRLDINAPSQENDQIVHFIVGGERRESISVCNFFSNANGPRFFTVSGDDRGEGALVSGGARGRRRRGD